MPTSNRVVQTCGILTAVLLIAASYSTASNKSCPDGCVCKAISKLALSIRCIGAKDGQTLLQRINDIFLLPSNASISDVPVSEMTDLEISDSPLVSVPRSICYLRTLRQLTLSRNQLRTLPDDCFVRLGMLVNITADQNQISFLQDGLFDGMSNLKVISLMENQISSIGLRLFSNGSDLQNLRTIKLDTNRLRTIDVWPYVRGRAAGNPESEVYVGLAQNYIDNTTNVENVKIGCGYKAPYLTVDLSQNKIKHMTDLLHGVGLANFTEYVCAAGKHRPRSGRTSTVVWFQWNTHYVCDCTDFEILRVQQVFFKALIFSLVFCDEPLSLSGREVSSVPLDEFVCDINERCPTACQCIYRPSNATMHIYCNAKNLTLLPAHLPPLPKSTVRYKIELRNNIDLHLIDDRDYFINVSIFDISGSGVNVISSQAWQRLFTSPSITQILINDNDLTKLPSEAVKSTNISSRLRIIRLDGNPWSCSRDDSWFATWLTSVKQSLMNPNGIVCNTPGRLRGRNVLSVPEEEFNTDPVIASIRKVLPTSISAIFVVTLATCLAVYRWRVRIFVRWNIHPFDRDDCIGEGLEYDVFLCCSSSDHVKHGLRILQELESRSYRVCYHLRDFAAGRLVMDNINLGVTHSKRTVCLLSDSFMQR
jgi:TIR domain/Leucine rich repeat/Leucine rich repeat C-terminal domain